MAQKIIDEILDIFKDYLGDELLKCNIFVTPNYSSLSHVGGVEYLTQEKEDTRKRLKDVLGKDKGFNFSPTKGMILWRIRPDGKRILEFKSDPVLSYYNSHIKNLKINLNTKAGSISHRS